jgi:myo-inositol catabolism protein IolC
MTMKTVQEQALYLLPFDHRHSYIKDMFKFAIPLTADERLEIIDSKQLIYEGFQEALGPDIPKTQAGVLVDEEFGSSILRSASLLGVVTALSVEKSGCDEFEFEYGDAFAEHIEKFAPTYAKVLVRFNPEGEADANRRQLEKLRRLSEYCQNRGQQLMFELLVPPLRQQLETVQMDPGKFDTQLRPQLMVDAIGAIQDAGVEPRIWKVEGLTRREDCLKIVAAAKRDGRSEVDCIVLGRGANEALVESWLEVAASAPGFIGFAVGRTTFWDPVARYEAGMVTRFQAASQIAQRFRHWITLFSGQTHDAPLG